MIFTESTFIDLYASTVQAFPNTRLRQHATQPIVIEAVRWTPFVGLKTLFIKAEARNEDRQYSPMLLFKGVQYGSGPNQLIADGMKYTLEPIDLEKNDLLLRCNCNDFRFRFNYYDHLAKSLYGRKASKYESKGVGPEANPKKMPGMCKHLIKMIESLRNSGICN